MIIIILLFFIFLISFYCYDNFYDDKIKIYSKNELINILLNDSDNYVNSFNDNDFMARNVKNKEEYYDNINNSCVDISLKLKNKIREQIEIANNKFDSYNIIGFDGKKCNNINWNIGIVNGSKYENGYPHTRDNIIIIPKSIIHDSLYSTLIHEKVHVYQKMYPEDIKIYLKNNNFNKINSNLINRANPDIDNNIYTDKNDKILSCLYNKNPQSISDVKCSYSEHPFEFMAYQIQNELY
jgi:hypothetical protein